MIMNQCKCGGSFDEHGLCFECDKPKPVSGANRKSSERTRKRKAGLVPMEFWVRPEHKEKLRAFAAHWYY
jgi:hypothetical protein